VPPILPPVNGCPSPGSRQVRRLHSLVTCLVPSRVPWPTRRFPGVLYASLARGVPPPGVIKPPGYLVEGDRRMSPPPAQRAKWSSGSDLTEVEVPSQPTPSTVSHPAASPTSSQAGRRRPRADPSLLPTCGLPGNRGAQPPVPRSGRLWMADRSGRRDRARRITLRKASAKRAGRSRSMATGAPAPSGITRSTGAHYVGSILRKLAAGSWA